MGRARNQTALAATAAPRSAGARSPRTRAPFVISADSVVATRDIRFRQVDYDDGSWGDHRELSTSEFERVLSIHEPVAPWPIASEILQAYQLKQQRDHERGLRVENPRSRRRAPEVQVPLLDRTALTWIVEAQQLAPSDFSFSVSSGYYGPEIDNIKLDSPNIDALARAYFALPNDPQERLRWLVQGVEGAVPAELESGFTFEVADVPLEAINEIVSGNDDSNVAAAWQGLRTDLAGPYNEYTPGSFRGEPDPVLAVVIIDLMEGYRVLSGTKRLRGLDRSLWARVPVYLLH